MTIEFEHAVSRLHDSICSLSARHQLELTLCLDGFVKHQREALVTSHVLEAPSELNPHDHHPSTPSDSPATIRKEVLEDAVRLLASDVDTGLPGAVIDLGHSKDTMRTSKHSVSVTASWHNDHHLRAAADEKDLVQTDEPGAMISAESAVSVVNKKRRKKKAKKNESLFNERSQDLDPGSYLHRLTTHPYYEGFSAGLIISNSIFIGWQTQFMAERGRDDALRGLPQDDQEPDIFFVLQLMFCISFSVELGLRWVCDGFLNFFKTGEVGWNSLDVVIVFFGIVDILLEMGTRIAQSHKPNELSSISVLRVLRIVRVVRVARVIRVMPFFRELRMMVYSILGCMKSLTWVLLVLNMMFYLFGLTFCNAANAYLNTSARHLDPEHEALKLNFGTVDRGILSLFMAMSGGNDWVVYYDSLMPLGLFYRWTFLLFIIFSTMAVANIVTGIFVESALQSNQTDRDIVVHEEMEEKKEYLKQMQQLFEEMDEDEKGTISFQEFESKLADERVIAFFNAMRLDASDAVVLFRLLDHDGSDEISIEEFTVGCYKLMGESRSLDMKIMQYEVRFLQESFGKFSEDLNDIKGKLDENASLETAC